MENTRQKNLKQNLWLFWVINFFSNFWFFTPIAALFFAQQGGSAAAALTVFSVMYITTSFFEIPTGVIGDRYSRKAVMIFAAVFALVSITVYAFSTNIIHLIIGAILAGFGNALSSGTGVAMKYETIERLGREHEFKKISAWINTSFPIAIGAASLIGGWLATYSLQLPFVVSIATALLYVFFSCLLVEPVRAVVKRESVFSHTKEALTFLFSSRTQLLLLVIGIVGWAIAFKVIFKAIPLLYAAGGMPVLWLGIAAALGELMSVGGMLLSQRVSNLMSDRIVLMVSAFFISTLLITATYLSGIAIGVPILVLLFFFGLRSAITAHLVQKFLPSHLRVTILSVRNLIITFSASLMAIVMGLLIDEFSIESAFRIMALVLAIEIIAVYLLPKKIG